MNRSLESKKKWKNQRENKMKNGDRMAFPSGSAPGLNKREYFAGLAMQGIMCTLLPTLNDDTMRKAIESACKKDQFSIDEGIADLAVQTADRLLKRFEQKPKNG